MFRMLTRGRAVAGVAALCLLAGLGFAWLPRPAVRVVAGCGPFSGSACDNAHPAKTAGWHDPLGGDWLDSDPLDGPEPPLNGAEPPLDWESLRLAAICRMLIEAQGLAL